MKKLLFLYFILIIVVETNAQEYSKEYIELTKEFYNDWVDNRNSNFSIGSTAPNNLSPDSATLRKIRQPQKMYQYKKRGQLANGNDDLLLYDSIILTKEEKLMIYEGLFKRAKEPFKWSADYFPDFKFAETKNVDILFTTGKNSKQFPHGICEFSLPIFFRQNTFCAIYYRCAYHHGGGSMAVELYRKENGAWKLFCGIDESDW